MSDNILHARILGEGLPLIVIHGFLGTGDNWLTLAKKWAESRKVFLVDMRNHGRSFHADVHDYPLMCEDIIRFMDFHQLETAEILGHSMGGKVAMYLALNYSEKVEKLIVVDIAPKPYRGGHEDIVSALNALPVDSVSSRKEAEDFLTERLSDAGVVLFLMKNLTRNPEGGFGWKMNLPALSSEYYNILAAIESRYIYDGETLFIKGGNSGYIKDHDEERIKVLFPKAEIVIVADAGHWVHSEQPEEFSNVVSDFLAL